MAGTVLDEFVILFGMDASGFQQGQRQTEVAFSKTRERAEYTAKALQVQGKKAAEFFDGVSKSVLALATAYLGLEGIKKSVAEVQAGESAIQRVSTAIGMNGVDLAAWIKVMEIAGQSSEETLRSFTAFSDKVQNLNLGENVQVIQDLTLAMKGVIQAGGALPDDLVTRMVDPNETLENKKILLADLFHQLKLVHQEAKATTIGASLGLGMNEVSELMKGRAAVVADVEAAKKRSGITAGGLSGAKKLRQDWVLLGQTIVGVVTPSFEHLYLLLDKIITRMQAFFDSHKGLISQNRVMIEDVTLAAIGFLGVWTGVRMASALLGIGRLIGAIGALTVAEKEAAAVGAVASGGLVGRMARAAGIAGLITWGASELGVGDAFAKFMRDNFHGLWSRANDAASHLGIGVGIPKDQQFPASPPPPSNPYGIFGHAEDWLLRQLGKADGAQHADATSAEEPPARTLAAIEHQESGGHQFDRNGLPLTSSAGAVGVMQLTHDAAKDAAKRIGVEFDWDKVKTDESYNRMLGAEEYRHDLAEFGGNQTLALAAYNAGEGSVRRWLRDIGDPRTGAVSEEQWAESIPFPETRNYVRSINAATRQTEPHIQSNPAARPPDPPALTIPTIIRPDPPALTIPTIIRPDPSLQGNATMRRPDPSLQIGAAQARGLNAPVTNQTSATTNTSEVNVGNVHVHTSATDATGIAQGLGQAIQRYAFAFQGNLGLT